MELRVLGGWAAVLTTALFVAGIATMAAGGVEALIPDANDAEAWLTQVDESGKTFQVGGALVIAGGFMMCVVLVALHQHLRSAGEWLILAPVLGLVAMSLVTASHVVPLGLESLTHDYVGGTEPARNSGSLSSLRLRAHNTEEAPWKTTRTPPWPE